MTKLEVCFMLFKFCLFPPEPSLPLAFPALPQEPLCSPEIRAFPACRTHGCLARGLAYPFPPFLLRLSSLSPSSSPRTHLCPFPSALDAPALPPAPPAEWL